MMSTRSIYLSAACLAIACVVQAAPCETEPAPPWEQLITPTIALRYRFLPDTIAVSQPLGLEVVVCPRQGAAAPERVRVDARMPAHGHGMNYRPATTQLATGHYRFDGLILHMPRPVATDF